MWEFIFFSLIFADFIRGFAQIVFLYVFIYCRVFIFFLADLANYTDFFENCEVKDEDDVFFEDFLCLLS